MNKALEIGDVLADVYKVVERVGNGGFGDVFVVLHKTSKQMSVVKMTSSAGQDFAREVGILKLLKDCLNFPNLVFNPEDYSFFVMELLGKDLDAVKNSTPNLLSMETVASVGLQLISGLKYFHKLGYNHRLEAEEDTIIYIIDLGITCKENEQTTGCFIGTSQFASTTAHKKLAQKFIDDLESMCFSLLALSKEIAKIKTGSRT